MPIKAILMWNNLGINITLPPPRLFISTVKGAKENPSLVNAHSQNSMMD